MAESARRPVLAVAAVVTALVILILAAVGIPVRAEPGAVSPPPAAVDQRAAAIVKSMNAGLQGVAHFEAKFTQTSSGLSYPTPMVQEGTLQVQKPDKLRWQFQTPTPRLFLSDGANLWVVDEKEKTCTHYSSVMESVRRFLDFFNGMADLPEHYQIHAVTEGPEAQEGVDTLKLLPRVKDGSIEVIYLHVDAATHLVSGVVTVSAFGDRTETKLHGIQVGDKLPAERFRWDNRPGFQVIEAG
jgi:outer membrane lipoprotein-sorting protein